MRIPESKTIDDSGKYSLMTLSRNSLKLSWPGSGSSQFRILLNESCAYFSWRILWDVNVSLPYNRTRRYRHDGLVGIS
jgi:hypothetical protein